MKQHGKKKTASIAMTVGILILAKDCRTSLGQAKPPLKLHCDLYKMTAVDLHVGNSVQHVENDNN